MIRNLVLNDFRRLWLCRREIRPGSRPALQREQNSGRRLPGPLWLFRGTNVDRNKMLEPSRKGEDSIFLAAAVHLRFSTSYTESGEFY
jgi:hypothetical protein